MFRINISHLLHKHEGERDQMSFSGEVPFDPADELVLKAPVTIETVSLIKLPHEISVGFTNLSTTAQAQCVRCLTLFETSISIANTEREFLIDLPQEQVNKDEDVFYVDTTSKEVDLYPMMREEILLHFPPIPVCCDGCKGLCSKCGANLNKTTCSCKPDTPMKLAFKKLLTT